MATKDAIDEKTIRYNDYIRRVTSEKLPAYEPIFNGNEIAYLADVINSGWVSEGKFCRAFEKSISQLVSRKYANITSCGTAALVIGMKALGLGEGDEVIVPTLSHSADPNSIASIGCKPVFCDVNPITLCIDEEDLVRKISKNTKAFFHIAAYGNYGNLDRLNDISHGHNIKFINDCAPALCSTFNSIPVASYGDFSMLSFFSDKTITTGEGGMLLSDNSTLMENANIYKHDGRRERGHDLIEVVGYNFRITEMQAAIGLAQFEQISSFLKAKSCVYLGYKNRIEKIPQVQLFEFKVGAVPHRVVVKCPDSHKLLAYLNERGVGARSMFHLMHKQPIYNVDSSFVYSQEIFNTHLCLPSAPTLSDELIGNICDLIEVFYNDN